MENYQTLHPETVKVLELNAQQMAALRRGAEWLRAKVARLNFLHELYGQGEADKPDADGDWDWEVSLDPDEIKSLIDNLTIAAGMFAQLAAEAGEAPDDEGGA